LILYVDAMKINVPTAAASQKDLEVELRTWFTNARDRGDDSRKRKTNAAPGTPAASTDAR
jgi:replicative DNA helicase